MSAAMREVWLIDVNETYMETLTQAPNTVYVIALQSEDRISISGYRPRNLGRLNPNLFIPDRKKNGVVLL